MKKRRGPQNLRKTTHENRVISIVLVSQDDVSVIRRVIEQIDRTLQSFPHYEIILVDNFSSESAVEQFRKLQQEVSAVRLLVLSKRTSTEIALTAGLENAIGDFVILFNQHTDPPATILRVIEHLETGADIVFARFPIEDFVFTSTIDRFLMRVIKKYYPRDFFSHINYFSGFNRRVVNSLSRIKRKRKDFSYINAVIGFRRKLMTYAPQKSTLKYLPKTSLLAVLIKRVNASLANSERPLRLALFIASLASFLNFSFLIYVLIISLVKHNLAEGWLTTSVMIGTMFLLLFLVLAILAEHILRIWDETHQEPVYFISEEVDNRARQLKRRLNVV